MKTPLDGSTRPQRQKGVLFWSKRLTLEPGLAELLADLDNPANANASVELLKQSPRRCVMRVSEIGSSTPSLIVKAFPLKKLEWRLKYKRYGLAEANNYQMLQHKDINAPELYAYFEHRILGTVKANGVLIEDLGNRASLFELILDHPELRLETLLKAVPVFRQLYLQGINHIDVTPQNLMVTGRGDLALIDWQYCSFVAPVNDTQLILQAAQFLRYAELDPFDAGWSDWLQALHEACGPQITLHNLSTNVAALQKLKRPSSAARMALSVPLPAET